MVMETNSKIGVVTNVSGKIIVKSADGSERKLLVGDIVYREDVVKSVGAGDLKVLMVDGTKLDITGELPFDFHDYLLIARTDAEEANRPSVDSIQKLVASGEDTNKIVEKYMCKIQSDNIQNDNGISFEVVPLGKYQTNFSSIIPQAEEIILPPSLPAVGSTSNVRFVIHPVVLPIENIVHNQTPFVAHTADLSVGNIVDNPTPNVGDIVTFTITLQNLGPYDATNVVVNDFLPAGLSFISASPSSGSFSGGVWTISSISSGATDTLTIMAKVVGVTPITNIANIVSSGEIDPNPANNISTNTTGDPAATVTPKAPDLSIIQSDISNDIGIPGTQETFLLTVTNSGQGDSPASVVTDILPAGFSVNIAATNFANMTLGVTVSVSGNIATFSSMNIQAGQSVTLDLIGNIAADATGNMINTATVNIPLGDFTPSNNISIDTVTLTPQVDLSVITDDGKTEAIPGMPQIYTITVTNNGPSTIHSLILTDTVPAVLLGPSFSPSTGSYDANTHIWSGLNLASGQSITMTLSGTIDPDATGSMTNTVNIEVPSGVADTNQNNNTASDTNTLIPQCDLSILKTVENFSGNVSQNIVTYTITVNNTGPSNATDVNVIDVFSPAGILSANIATLSLISQTQGGFNAETGAWSVGTISIGGSATLVFTATIMTSPQGSQDLLGNINNTATVTSTSLDINPDNNISSANVLHQVVWVPDAANTTSSDPVQNQLLGDYISGYALFPTGFSSGGLTIEVLQIPTWGLVKYFDGSNFITITPTDVTNHLVLTVSEFNSLVYIPDSIFSPSGDFGQFKYGLLDGTNESAVGIVDIHTVPPMQPFNFDEITVGDRSHPLTSGQDVSASITITQSEISGVGDFSNGSITFHTDFQKTPIAQPIPSNEQNDALSHLHSEISIILTIDGVNFTGVTQTSNDAWTIDTAAGPNNGLWMLTLNFEDIKQVSDSSISLSTYLSIPSNFPEAGDVWTVTYEDHDGGNYQARFVEGQFSFNADARPDIVVQPSDGLNISGVNEPNVIYGSTGNDSLTGGLDNDVFIGREGNDSINLVNENDTVKYNTVLDGTDILKNFNTGDKLDLTALFDSLNIPVEDRAAKVQVVNTEPGIVDINVDTAAAPGFDLHVATIHTFAPISVGQDVVVGA